MLRTLRYLLLVTFTVNTYFVFSTINPSCIAHAEDAGTVAGEVADALQELSPESRKSIKSDIFEQNNILTPDTLKILEEIPDFIPFTQEDIEKGKKILDEKEAEKKEPEKEEDLKKTEISAKEKEKRKSLFDRYRIVGSYQTISTDLRPFGYDFFSDAAKTSLILRKDIPVSPDYIIGPGDEVKIMFWGRVNADYNLVVNKDGNITVPQIGPLQVSGMRFNDMKILLAKQAEQIIGAKISVTLGSLKSIQVFVLGEVREPGSYALDPFSTITGAILASGGPTEIGSLRNVQLKRKNKTVAVMDFYNFLLTGDKSQDNILQSGDVIFVPTTGPLVGLAGNVKRPAIYELKNKYDLMTLFDMAGGLIPSAYTQQIQVSRIQKGERQIVMDINDRDLTKSKDIMLEDGDMVKIFSIVDKDMNVVFLAGNVKRPGKYEYKPGMRVSDLIDDSADLLKETHFEYALIKRLNPPGLETQLVPFNLGKLLSAKDGPHNVLLKPQDVINVFSVWMFKDRPYIFVEGEVRKAGNYELLENQRVKDAILGAGGLTRDASRGKSEIFRINENGDVSQIYFNVALAMAGDQKENKLLQHKDKIKIHSIWEEKQKQTVSIEGDIKNPGQYLLADNMRISDLIFSAGNVLESAYLDETEVSSFIITDGKSMELSNREINLRLALKNDTEHDILLKPYDRVFVRRIPEWKEKRFVNVSGEITFPGRYIIGKGERMSSVLERAGGYSSNAYLRGSIFTRENVRELQQKSLDDMILRLERELLAEGSVKISSSFSHEELEAQKVDLQQRQKFIESLKTLKATGRMSINLTYLRLLKGSRYDIKLEDNDSIHIPMKNSVINVVGAVMSRGSFIYSEEMDYKDYISMSGGYTRFADKDNIYVLKVDGTARKLSNGLFKWNMSANRWELSTFGEKMKDLEPGDTIVVPEKFERIAWLREVKDITQILYQIAIATGVTIALF